MLEDKMILSNGSTPLTAADAIIRECADKEWLDDVIFYLQMYVRRTYGELIVTEPTRQEAIKAGLVYPEKYNFTQAYPENCKAESAHMQN